MLDELAIAIVVTKELNKRLYVRFCEELLGLWLDLLLVEQLLDLLLG